MQLTSHICKVFLDETEYSMRNNEGGLNLINFYSFYLGFERIVKSIL